MNMSKILKIYFQFDQTPLFVISQTFMGSYNHLNSFDQTVANKGKRSC